jgi:hypothetical protein
MGFCNTGDATDAMKQLVQKHKKHQAACASITVNTARSETKIKAH